MKRLFFSLAWLLVSFSTFAQMLEGTVVRVLDGDTYDVEVRGTKLRCRLINVDAPEKDQFYGLNVKSYVENILYGKMCEVRLVATDYYKRHVVEIVVNGEPLDSLLISKGLAWRNPYFCTKEDLDWIELQAKQIGLGLWFCKNPTAPWIWRNYSRRQKRIVSQCL
ncbi:thermonuclease family protein [Emticicia sp. SJ17W-69]|uniref:thermonuclease family protein n=1 Tax=Emticicia sp. SJ17W-69 TaxID=3421657 RepID=UPI003EBC6C2E